ncbi:phosphoglycerol transferase MdoB-like AlkP superfamily enzyme [Desulfitobacterium sp. LBE]|uniref:LTA synthase family protein n=1 Tax=Desulfitobacterium sp. LBE TaxID=884086 RepID=UPI00119AC145|nr:LTA synthase family protein [Desulfitobacterium sp. LBE]TWH55944.1 phosphoglycerol transferase MdoB-like AlkP superfamily enzyme [Desulfitobacterium sp. LBE]
MPVLQYESIKRNLRPIIDLVPDPFWWGSFIIGYIKVIAFMGLTTSWNNSWEFYFVNNYAVSSVIALCFTLLFFSAPLLFKGRSRLWVTWVFSAILAFLLFADLVYYRGYGDFLTFHLIAQLANLEDLGGSIVSLIYLPDALFFIDCLVGLLLLIVKRELGKEIRRQTPWFLLICVLAVGFIYSAHYRYDRVENGQNQIVFRICWTPTDTMRNLSPVGYHFYEGYVYFKENQVIELTPEQEEEIENWYVQHQEDSPADQYQGIFAGQNLILLQVESLENFVINQSYNGQEITPTLNRLLQDSIYFPNFYEQVWNGTTSDAELLTNASVYPVRRGSTFFRYPLNEYNSLPKLLAEKGYTTQASHPDNAGYWNWVQALSAMGFANTLDITDFVMDEKIGLGLSDGSYLRQMLPILEQSGQPFYDFIITMTSHGPFDLPQEYRELEIEPQLDRTKLGGYFQSIRYVDKQIGMFIESLDQKGLLDNTVIVIYGDHEGIHKYYNDELAGIQPQEDWWMANDRKVPLIIYKKDMGPKIIETTGGQIDVLPTVAYLMGIEEEKYAGTAQGRNLLTTQRDYAVLADGTFVGTSKELEDHAIKGLSLSDLIIQSNYFDQKEK